MGGPRPPAAPRRGREGPRGAGAAARRIFIRGPGSSVISGRVGVSFLSILSVSIGRWPLRAPGFGMGIATTWWACVALAALRSARLASRPGQFL